MHYLHFYEESNSIFMSFQILTVKKNEANNSI